MGYFDCLLFMVMLVTVIIGTVVSGASDFASLAENIISSLSTLLDDLADGLSNMSSYFMLYVLLNAFIWLPLELYRPAHYIKKLLGRPEPNRFNYAVWFAKSLLILTIVVTYGAMAPLMFVIGFTYFVFANFVFTYNLSMSWVPEFETGAKLWPLVFGRIRIALMLSIVTMIGLMALKTAYVEAAILIPLMFIVWFLSGAITLRFRPIFRSPSITSASGKDTQINRVINQNHDNVNGVHQFGDKEDLDTAYLPHIMKVQYPSYEERVRMGSSVNGHHADDVMSLAGAGPVNGADANGHDASAAEYDSYQNEQS